MKSMSDSSRKFGLMSRKVLLGTTLGAALFFMIVGVIVWGGFNTAMEATNTLDFCISCHEMEENVYQEYKKTIHYTNRSGVVPLIHLRNLTKNACRWQRMCGKQ